MADRAPASEPNEEHALGNANGHKVHNPHDAWYQAILEDPRRAQDVLWSFLPPPLVAQLENVLPERMQEKFLDHRLQRRFGDFVFRVRRKPEHGGADLHVIVEHQSTNDPDMAVRTLVYKALLLDRLVGHRNAPEGFPQVVVLVLYHGARPWSAPLTVEDPVPSGDPSQPVRSCHSYILADLARRKENELGSDPVLRAALRLSCLAFRPSVHLEEVAATLRSIPSDTKLATQAIPYIMETFQADDTVLRGAVWKAWSERGARMMQTMADRLRQEGEARGEARGRAAILLRLMSTRYGELSDEVRAQVGTATPDQLEAWAEAILEAGSAEELLQNGRPN